jgi:hypothetical protein
VKLISYIDNLAHKNSEALSFIPLPKIESYIKVGQVLTETENDDLCGYLIWGNGWPVLRIYQACIQYDVRQLRHGMNIVKQLIQIAEKRHCVAISLWCADDLEANAFWQSIGFQFAGQREGGKRRGRKHNRWILPLNNLLS